MIGVPVLPGTCSHYLQHLTNLKHEFHFCCHFYLCCSTASFTYQENNSSAVIIIMAANRESASQHARFKCSNVNCYAVFKTERGLKQHLWRSEDCGKYMSEPRPVLAARIGIVHESTWRRRVGYGIESSRVNPFMGADAPSYEPYEVFDYSVPMMMALTTGLH